MGLILGIIAVAAGVIGVRYSVLAIVTGVTAVMAYFGVKRE